MSRGWRLAALAAPAVLAAGCGSQEAGEQATRPGADDDDAATRPLGRRYAIAVTLPAGWDGRLGRGALHAASFPLPAAAPGSLRAAF